tara:strand:- start:249 stop:734 length:486 start_codon:yes stop_codon:yes gene_type:complete
MKRAPFKLKSGNKPSFKTMASSPYKADENGEENEKVTVKGKSALGKGKDLLVDMASAGLSAVYGTPRTNKSGSQPKVVISKDKENKEVDDAPPNDKITENVINNNNNNENNNKEADPYTIQEGDTLSQLAADNDTTVEELMKKNPQIKDKNKIYTGDDLKL